MFSRNEILLAFGILVFIFLFLRSGTGKESFEPLPPDVDVNACIGLGKEFQRMIWENQGQLDKKKRDWEKQKDTIVRELELGQKSPTSPYLGAPVNAVPFSFNCDGRGNFISSFDGWSSYHGSIGGPAGKGKRHYLLKGLRARCKSGALSPVYGVMNGNYWKGSCAGGYNEMDITVRANHEQTPYGFRAKCLSGGNVSSPLSNPTSSYTRPYTSLSYPCPPSTVLKGLSGHHGGLITKLKFRCAPIDYLPPPKGKTWESPEAYFIAKGNATPTSKDVPLLGLPCEYCTSRLKGKELTDDEKIKLIQDCANEVKERKLEEEKRKRDEELSKVDESDRLIAEKAAQKLSGKVVKNEEEEDVRTIAKKQAEAQRASTRRVLYIGGGSSSSLLCLLVIGIAGFFFMRKK